jgi:cation:H+ antiporter
MALASSAVLFGFSVALTLAAAALFADRLDHIGPRVGLPESLTGLLTAFAADGPEISSALIALSQGERRIGLGIVLGSNVFNIAAMIGMSAVLVGSVRLGRKPLLVEASVGMLATLLAAGAICDLISPVVALVGLAIALVPYLILISRGAPHIPHPHSRELSLDSTNQPALWIPVGLALAAVVLIVVGSFGMVDSAVSIAHRLNVPASIVGILVLATVTSLPNAFTAIRLGMEHRGAALVSETLNSNTINLGAGVILPAVIIGLSSASGLDRFDLAWLILMTTAAILLLARPFGVGRLGGAGLVALYVLFLAVHLIWP